MWFRDMYNYFLYKNVKKYADVERMIESKYGEKGKWEESCL